MPILNMVGGGKKGGNIGEPLNLAVTSVGLDATITREDNEIGTIPPTTFQKSELVRKIGSAPTSPSDGDLVVTETVKDTYKVSGYVDQGLTDGETYYYRVFSYSDLGGISYCDAVSVTISNSWQPGVDTVLYYDFEHTTGTAEENLAVSGSTYDGVYTATPTISTLASGKKYFDNSGTTYLYSSNTLSTVNYDVMTVCCRIYNPSILGQEWWGISGNKGTIMIEATSNGYDVALGAPGNEMTFSGPTNTWINVVLVNDGTKSYVYLNGNKEGEKALTTSTGNRYLYLGTLAAYNESNQPSGLPIRGTTSKIGSFIIENKTWSAQDISDYFDQTKGDYGIS